LIYENLPKRLKKDFEGHIVFTVRDMGWNGIKNGLLLERMLANGFQCFFTFDKNMQFQQNFEKYSIPVIVLNSDNNTYLSIAKLLPQILVILATELKPGINLIHLESSH